MVRSITAPPRGHNPPRPFTALAAYTPALCEELLSEPNRRLVLDAHAHVDGLLDVLAACAAKSMSPRLARANRVNCVHNGQMALTCLLAILCAVTSLPAEALAWWPAPIVSDLREVASHVAALGATLDRAAAEVGLSAFADPSLPSATVALVGGA